MNFIELVGKTWVLAGLTGTAPSSVENQAGMQARIIEYVRQAYLEVQQVHTNWDFHWRETAYDQTLTTGIKFLLPDDFGALDYRKMHRVWIAEPQIDPAVEIQWSELTYMHSLRNTSDTHKATVISADYQGKPSILHEFPRGRAQTTAIWELNRQPDKDYPFKFSYYCDYDEMVEDTDEPVIPEPHRMTIVYKALELYSFYDEDSAINKMAERQYARALHRLEREAVQEMSFKTSPFLG